MQISYWHNIRGYTKMRPIRGYTKMRHSIQESGAKKILPVCLGKVLTISYTYFPSV